jgi:UDP-glucuronate decarboxylase
MVLEPLPIDDPKRRRPEIKRAELLLGWRPVVELSEGLKATISDLSKQLKQPSLQLA